jgi:hypothetical protein
MPRLAAPSGAEILNRGSGLAEKEWSQPVFYTLASEKPSGRPLSLRAGSAPLHALGLPGISFRLYIKVVLKRNLGGRVMDTTLAEPPYRADVAALAEDLKREHGPAAFDVAVETARHHLGSSAWKNCALWLQVVNRLHSPAPRLS